jgi:hypothetical protein
MTLFFGVWCTIGATTKIGLNFFSNTINSEKYIGQILVTFFENFIDKGCDYGFFQQDGALPI